MDTALLEPATVVAGLVAAAVAGRRLAAWLHPEERASRRERPRDLADDLLPAAAAAREMRALAQTLRYRFPDGTTHPTRAESDPSADPAAALRGELDRCIKTKREFFRITDAQIERDPAIRDLLREIREIEAAHGTAAGPEAEAPGREIDKPAGTDATWTPLRERPAGRWVED